MDTFKGLMVKVGKALYERVWVAKKSTFLGLGFLVAEVVVQTLAGTEIVWLHAVAGLAATLLALYKPKVPAVP